MMANPVWVTLTAAVAAVAMDACVAVAELLVSDVIKDHVLRLSDSGSTNGIITAGLDAPAGLAISGGNLYVASAATGEILGYDLVSGMPEGAFVTANAGGLTDPNGIAFGPDGDLYVADFSNDAVRRYDGVTGTYVGSIALSHLTKPIGLAFDGTGRLYVASGSGTIERYDTAGTHLDTFATTAAGTPLWYLAFGENGDLYAADYFGGAVRRFDAATGSLVDSASLVAATGLAFAPDGTLFATSYTGRSITAFDAATLNVLDTFDLGDGVGPTAVLWVPEPGSLALCTGAGLLLSRRRRSGR